MRPTRAMMFDCAVIILAFYPSFGPARQNQDLHQIGDRVEYIVEVTAQGMPPAKIRVSKQRWGETGLAPVRRAPAAHVTPGASILETARIEAKLDGETVRIDLSFFFDNDKRETVASYLLRENETTEIPGLPEYGIKPVTLRVVRAPPIVEDPTPTDRLHIVNNVAALEVVRLEKENPTSTVYQLELLNISHKNVVTVDLYIPDPENRGGSGQTAHMRDRPLIKAGQVWKTEVRLGRSGRTTPQGYAPDPPREKSLIVRALIFEDGTYEGDADAVAAIQAGFLGRKITFMVAIDLFESARQRRDQDPADLVKQLKEAIYSIQKDVGADLLDGIISRFPSLSGGAGTDLKFRVEAGIRNTKQMVIRELQTLEDSMTSAREHVNLDDWLMRAIERYRRAASF